MRPRDLVAVGVIALVAATLVESPAFERLRGLTVDVLLALRHVVAPPPMPARPPVVVVAIDEETYRRAPFADTPRVTWTQTLGTVIGRIVEADAAAVGLDIIFPTSMDRFVPGFDRDFLRALRTAATANKIVLGKVQHQAEPITPFEGQQIAVGRGRNVHAVNLVTDSDDVIRRVPLYVEATASGVAETAFALELAARAAPQPPTRHDDGRVTLGDRIVPGSDHNALLLNLRGGWNAIPSYSLADLAACAEAGNSDYFRRHFAGRVVVLGTMLDIEDRKITSKRLMTGPEGPTTAERCVLPPMTAIFDTSRRRDEIPGVMIHATAVENLLRGDALLELPRWAEFLVSLALALGAATLALRFSPLPAVAIVGAGAVGWTGAGVAFLTQAIVLPLFAPLAAGGLAVAAMLGYRFAVADRDKRMLRKSFALYLAPALIDRMMASEKQPELGGEDRSVTIFFSDVAGFSSFSERMTPEELVTLMNAYLTAMSDIIEDHNGYVERYMGDAIVALFGAPLDDPDHAASASRAALACVAALEKMNRDDPIIRGHDLAHRIGLSSGSMLVGNIGSKRRFNYTAMGDLANLGARLEGANKFYGTPIMVSEETRRLAGDSIVWRELDLVRVKGRESPVRIFEPLGLAAEISDAVRHRAATYAEGLDHWRGRRFAAAEKAFAAIADGDPAARSFLARVRVVITTPPGPDWEPIHTLDSK